MARQPLWPCLRCQNLQFWRNRKGQIFCGRCKPPTAYWLIVERLRAVEPVTALDRAIHFINVQRAHLQPGQLLSARQVIEAAKRKGISPATLTRARLECGLRARKTWQGWIWTESPRRS